MTIPPDQPDHDSPPRYEEFLAHFARERDRLFAYVYSLLPHQADAEDVFQRCSMLLWSKFEQFEADRDFLAWARGVAFYEVRNFLRTAQRDRLQFNEELIGQIAERRVETLDQHEDRLTALRGCLENLQQSERELIRQVYTGGNAVKELARETGRAAQTLYNQLSQARRKLLTCVEHKLALEG